MVNEESSYEIEDLFFYILQRLWYHYKLESAQFYVMIFGTLIRPHRNRLTGIL